MENRVGPDNRTKETNSDTRMYGDYEAEETPDTHIGDTSDLMTSSIADKIWKNYKWILTYPAGSLGKERRIGIALYFINLSIAIGLIILTLAKSTDVYSESRLEYYPKIKDVQFPDMIICPSRYRNTRAYEFNVNYNHRMIDDYLMMTIAAVNNLTRLKFEACPQGGECVKLNSQCGQLFQEYCDRLNATFQKTHENQAEKKETCSLDDLAFNMWIDNDRIVTLEILWLKILRWAAMPSTRCINRKPSCLTWLKLDCFENATSIWFDTSFCIYVPKFFGGHQRTRYTYLYGFYGDVDYWIGNIETQEVSMSLTTSRTVRPAENMSVAIGETLVRAAYFYFEIVEISDATDDSQICIHQPNLKGRNTPCVPKLGAPLSNLFYKTQIINERLASKPSVYHFPTIVLMVKTKQMIIMKKAMTSYARFQLVASLFSCFVGHSILQLLYFIGEKCRVRSLLKHILGLITVLSLIGVTIFMGHRDLNFYYENQYSTVLDDRTPIEQYPVFEFQLFGTLQPYSFINITKLEQYNVSLEFYFYLLLMNFEADPVSLGVYNNTTNNSENMKIRTTTLDNCTSTQIPRNWTDLFRRFMNYSKNFSLPLQDLQITGPDPMDVCFNEKISQDIRSEALRLNNAFGYYYEVSLAELASNFMLKPSRLLTDCKLGKISIDCCRYCHFYRRVGKSVVFTLRLPRSTKELTTENSLMLGWENSLSFFINMTEYQNHGLRKYFGPNVSKFKDSNEPKGSERYSKSYKEFHFRLAVSMPGNWISEEAITTRTITRTESSRSYQFHVRSDIRKRERPESNCFTESERLCSNPVEDANMLYLSVQLWKWCGCIECPHKYSSHRIDNVISEIIGSPSICCTVTLLTECYTKHLLETLKSSKDGTGKTSWYVRFYLNRGIHISDMRLSDSNDWSTVSQETMNELIRGFEEFDRQTQDKLISFTKKCFQRPCKKFALKETKNYYEEEKERLLIFAFNYDSAYAEGIKEIDRSHPVEFLGVLTCSYSLVFGIGLIGIVEIGLGFLVSVGAGRGKKAAKRQLTQHLIKTMGFWFSSISDNKIAETASSPCNQENRKPASTEDTAESQTSKNENNVDEVPTKLYPGIDGKLAEFMTAKIDDRRVKGYTMLVSLILSAAVMTFTIVVYFNWMENKEILEEVIQSPKVRSPSIKICAGTQVYALEVLDILKRSNCSENEMSKFASCDTIFSLYYKKTDSQYCFIFDNSHSRRLDMNFSRKNLVIKSPEFFPKSFIAFFDIGYIDDKAKEFELRQSSAKVLYNVKIRRNEILCHETEKTHTLEKCYPDFITRKSPYICSLNGSQNFNPDIIKTPDSSGSVPCESYEYELSISLHNPISDDPIKQFIVIQPHQDFAIMSTVKPKYNQVVLLSIIGGFVGSFIELTIMNGCSLMFFIFSGLFKLFKRLM